MKPLVKTVASTAVVLAALAGCASRSAGGANSAAGAGSTTSSSAPSSAPSAPSDGTTSTQNGSQPGAPGSSAPSSAPSGGQQSAPGSQPGGSATTKPGTDANAQVKYVSPQGVSLETDGITLVTQVEWGGCNDQPQLVVMSQDASKVVIELKTTSHYRIGVMCPNIAREGSASVKLAAPLGSRQVIDGVKNVALSVK